MVTATGRRRIPIYTKQIYVIFVCLRIVQHTPGTDPRSLTHNLWRNSFYFWGLGYAPVVCWGSLRILDYVISTTNSPLFVGWDWKVKRAFRGGSDSGDLDSNRDGWKDFCCYVGYVGVVSWKVFFWKFGKEIFHKAAERLRNMINK